MELAVFWIAATVAVAFALVVVLHRNPVSSVLALVVTLFALAILFVLLDAPFVAALEIIVYAGAIMVLFLFVIMLLNIQREEREPEVRRLQRRMALLAGAILASLLVVLLLQNPGIGTMDRISPQVVEQRGNTELLGMALFANYLVPFEAVSLLLTAAMVGALLLAKRELR